MMKIALVHDFLVGHTGAERVLAEIAKLYPEAPIYTLLYDKDAADVFFASRDIRPSFLQRFPSFMQRQRKFLLPFFSTALEHLDLTEFDLVISSSGAWSKGVITRTDALHVCYCHTPMRFVWDYTHPYQRESGLTGWKGLIASPLLTSTRLWDRVSADRVDHYIANSKTVAERIEKYYRKPATVIYPNVDCSRFTGETSDEGYFLSVGRLEPYKNVGLLIDAFNQRPDLSLKIVGHGSQYDELKKRIQSPNITLLGYQSDEEVNLLMRKCRAFLFPVNDDFGIVPVEAMSCGKPVIALRKGGVRETVLEGKTGIFFDEPTTDALLTALDGFKHLSFDEVFIRRHASTFSTKVFRETFAAFVEEKIASFVRN